MNFYYHTFFKLAFLIGYSFTASSAADLPTYSTQVPWATSLNITFNGREAKDERTSLASQRLSDWHMSQAPLIADIYNNYQTTGRNAAKGLISFVYTLPGQADLKIVHLPLQHIFLNGWHFEDSQVASCPRELRNKLHFHPQDIPAFSPPEDFICLKDIVEQDKNLIRDLLNWGLIPKDSPYSQYGFKGATDFLNEMAEKTDHIVNDPPHVKNIKKNQTHSEKLILIYIYKHLDRLIDQFPLPEHAQVKYTLIHMASYRDMCSQCQEMAQDQKPLNILLKAIQEKIQRKLNLELSIPLKVICSGIAHIQRQRRPIYEDRFTPISLQEEHQILYMGQNPLYTYALDRNINSQQYLTIMKSYLPYHSKTW